MSQRCLSTDSALFAKLIYLGPFVFTQLVVLNFAATLTQKQLQEGVNLLSQGFHLHLSYCHPPSLPWGQS